MTPPLSQERLAKKLGVSRSTYANYEQGRRMPPVWFVFSTANYFCVPVEVLFQEQTTIETINRKGGPIQNESIAHRNAKKNRG